MTPQLIAGANSAIALAFFIVSGLIVTGLVRDRSLGINPLGVATALVFLTCASGHAMHAEHYFLRPEAYAGDTDLWHQLVIDLFTLGAAVAYLAQRRRYGLVIRGVHPMLDYRERLRMAEALRDIGQDIAAQTDFDGLLRLVVRHARDLLSADYAAVVTVDASGKPHRQVIGTRTEGWDDAAWKEAVFLGDGSAPGSVAAGRGPVVVGDLMAGSRAKRSRQGVHSAEGGRSALAVPIFQGRRVGGSLMVAYRSVRGLTRDEVSSAAALAGQAAIAMETAQLIESLRKSDRLKDEFLSAAAHELRTPVTTIKGWAEMLLRTDGQRVDGRKGLEAIHHQAQRITRLSEDLVAAMSLEPGLPTLRREPFDLSTLVLESVEQVQRSESRRQIHVATSGPLTVEADRRLIAEMIGRLLENAIRYSPAGQPIEVETHREGAEAVVSVMDHGTGIPLERQPHVFEPFYEPVPPGSQGYVGTVSLGLHLSKQIVDAHGGRIWFASAPGKGSTFSFSLTTVA